MKNALIDYYRCAIESLSFEITGDLSSKPGFFQFDGHTVYGRASTCPLANTPDADLSEISGRSDSRIARCLLPFSPEEVIENLQTERYAAEMQNGSLLRALGKSAYYRTRSLLPFQLRSLLKRISLKGWDRKAFPAWPVDRTVDRVAQQLMLLAMKALNVDRLPFIWFWPAGYTGCAIMTHDVETLDGLQFCVSLMDLDDSFGIKSSFQLIPNGRYSAPLRLLDEMRGRGFEINIHDWNHDGKLFSTREVFAARAAKINHSAQLYQAEGFRSGALYRNTEWFDDFTFSYDMSVPNAAHLDPQPGGCCTVMPYFVGKLLEIPVTATQDYMLFHILKQYSIDLWKKQAELILEDNGLLSFIVHPDYIIEKRAQSTYKDLLGYLVHLRTDSKLWLPLPKDVDRWWRSRSQMHLMRRGSNWAIEGPDSERAQVAFAVRDGDSISYELARKDKPADAFSQDTRMCVNSSTGSLQ